MKLKPQTKIAIVYRLATPSAVNLANTLAEWLLSRGCKVYTAPNQKVIKGSVSLRKTSDLKKMSSIIALGGDGTYLRAVRMLDGMNVPVLGINLGSLGFLTTTKANETFAMADQLLEQKLKLTPRSMLEISLIRKGVRKWTLIALNDLVIERGSLSQLINMSIQIKEHPVCEIKADGVILASPTGSTAYNLSAGGPIVHPDVSAFVLTPIAPHSLTSRPLVLSDRHSLSIRLVGKLQKAHLVLDGQRVAEVGAEDLIEVKKSPLFHWMIQDKNYDFFHLLREKLKFSGRA